MIRWINDYQATLQDLGIEEEDTRFPTKEQSGMALLIDQYIRRMQATRQTWSQNILEVLPLCSLQAASCAGGSETQHRGHDSEVCWEGT